MNYTFSGGLSSWTTEAISSAFFADNPPVRVSPKSLMAFRVFPTANGSRFPASVGDRNATGFLYDYGGARYLVTNWHVVAGRRPDDHSSLSLGGVLPDALDLEINSIYLRLDERNFSTMVSTVTIPLYDGDRPLWFIHPRHKEAADVVAVPFSSELPDVWLTPIDQGAQDLRLDAGMDVFLLGFPRGVGSGSFPIWKRGSFASEPYQSIGGLPKIYIDSATKDGMSGAPVFATARGSYYTESGEGAMMLGAPPSRFVGIYSGRVGHTELEAQLAVVWTNSAIVEVIQGGEIGTSSRNLKPRDVIGGTPIPDADVSLMRDILFAIKEGRFSTFEPLCDAHVFYHQLRLLCDARYIEGQWTAEERFRPERLMAEGDDFLALVHDADVWDKVKANLAERPAVSLNIARITAEKIFREKLATERRG